MIHILKIKLFPLLTFYMLLFSITTVFAQNSTYAGITADNFIKENENKIQNQVTADFLPEASTDNTIELKTVSEKNTKKTVLQNTTVVDIPQTEKDALLAFYNSTNGPNWTKNTGWDFSKPVTSWNATNQTGWFGVTVTNGNVTGITLTSNNLTGYMTPEISKLIYLKSLILHPNKITGSIPVEISKLSNLLSLNLSWNLLTGGIPTEITTLKNLTSLSLAGNPLGGSIPNNIGEMAQKLSRLELSQCKLNGTIPESLGQLLQLYGLYLDGNQLTGNIPESLGNLNKIRLFWLNGNQLSGNIPESLSNLTAVESFSLGGNQLTGSIPSFSGLIKIIDLGLSKNKLSGTIPGSLGNLKTLKSISLNGNQLTGSIPNSLTQLPLLKTLRLGENKLSGLIPDFSTSNLANFDIYYNNFRFIDITNPFSAYKSKFTTFNYSPQSAINTAQTITRGLGKSVTLKMFADNDTAFHPEDTFQWFKNNVLITGATDKNYTISNVVTSSAGTYTCRSYHSANPDMSPLILARQPIILKTVNCTSISGTIKDLPQKLCSNTAIDVVFETSATNLSYNWSSTTSTGEVVYTNNTNTTNSQSFNFNTGGNYIIKLEVTNAEGCSTVFTKNITIASCIKEEYCTNEKINFNFQTTSTGGNYEWSTTTLTGETVDTQASNTTGLYSYTFSIPGEYVVRLLITESNGCAIVFTKNIIVKSCANTVYCVNQKIDFSFQSSTTTNQTYNWSSIDASGVVVNEVSNITGLYNFTPLYPGKYTIKLTTPASTGTAYETLFLQEINVDSCTPFVSCTKTNLNTPIIKDLLKTLVNKLISIPEATIIDGYYCPELTALAPYINNGKGIGIYNFKNDINTNYVTFSFFQNSYIDIKIAVNESGSIDFNLDNFDTSEIPTPIYAPSTTLNGFVKQINFCAPIYCESHVAIVVDESGSIDSVEANKIKKQLKEFIKQQANTNETLKTNIYISLIGMSDRDSDVRGDHVRPTKITNEPAVMNKFIRWIDKYRSRDGQLGVSPGSDYWKSGLDAALASTMKPNMVLMITDGSQTANVTGLKATMSQFNNSKSTTNPNSDKPHLYVVGIQNGFYVGRDALTPLSRNQDPNYVPSVESNSNESARVAPLLLQSLKFLLDYPETEFPVASIDDFGGADYFGHDNFNLLASDATYFSDKLTLGEIVCGSPTIKDFCSDCYSFQPEPGKEYMLSAWVKEEQFIQVKNYENAAINLVFYNDKKAEDLYIISTLPMDPSGDIIDGWQRIVGKFTVPINTITIGVELENKSNAIPVYFDDIRVHPIQGSIKTFVYDPETFKLMSELDENNYSTFYEYDNEGGLVRVKKETAKGIKTIQETRSGTVINTQNEE